MESSKWSNEEISYLIHNFKKYTYKELGNKLGRTRSAIQSKISKLGLMKDTNSIIRYTYDKNYFSNIDTDEKAYWVGFISADGCIVEKSDKAMRLKIALKHNDKNHLIKLSNALQSNLPVKDKHIKYNNSDYQTAEIDINSTKLCQDLINIGVTSNKTYTITLPIIKDSLIPSFLRGFIDGDGSYYFNKFNNRCRYSIDITGASLKIFEQIQAFFI